MAAAQKSLFAVPKEPTAWWSFCSSALGGLLAVAFKAPENLPQALPLTLAAAFFFLSSDWLSSLGGRGQHGEIPKGSLNSGAGLALIGLAVISIAWFFRAMPHGEARFWVLALASTAAMVALMYFLRMEMVAFDLRLLYLSGALATLPALLLGFLAFGPYTNEALYFWLPLAALFPSGVACSQVWLRGTNLGGKPRLALLALPLLSLIVGALVLEHFLFSAAVAGYLAWMMRQLLHRFRDEPGGLPAFAEIMQMQRGLSLWFAALTALWLQGAFDLWG